MTEKYVTVGIWGPNARATLQKVVEDPAGLCAGKLPVRRDQAVKIAGKDVTAFRISYVGEQGWELHMRYEDGLAVWDALRSTGVMPFGVETYANTRRMEKSLRLQNADLLTEYNLLEADLARPKVKEADFRGKAKHEEYRARKNQPAMLCTLVMTDNRRFQGRGALSRRHHAGDGPGRPARRWSMNSAAAPSPPRSPTGRRSARTSRSPICRGPIARKAASFRVEYFGETYPVEVAASATSRSTIRRT